MSSPGGSASSPETRSTKEVFHRLVRTMSGRSISSNEAANSVAAAQVGESSPMLQRTESSTSSTSQSKGKRRSSIGDKLKKLAKDIPLGNLKKTASKGVPASPKVTSANLLPESSGDAAPSGHAKMLSMVAETTEMDESSSAAGPSEASPNPANDNPSPGTLAKRLQDLIDALPFPDYTNQPIKNPKPPARDKKGRPVVPPGAEPIKDSKLIALLQSATFMNGGKADQPRKSIWDVLEQIGVPPHGFPETDEERNPDDDGNTRDEPAPDTPDIFTDNSSIMVYSPLIPGLDDHVELAELVPVGVEEEFIDESSSVTATAWTSIWPLSIISGYKAEEVRSMSSNVDSSFQSHMSGDVVYSPAITTIDELGRRVRVKTVRAWVPSTTKLSFQAMWWGYRLWLPPPVLAILSDKTIEATKRAAMITTALTWFFNHLPIDALPLPVRPAALLMQRIVPFLGYIGTFISWSWSTIKSYDIGYGVTLTSTWLLPIALIPGTWFERDFPKSQPQSPPTNLPDSKAPTPSTPAGSPPTPLPSSPPVPTTPSQPSTSPTSPAPATPPTTTPGPTQPSTGSPPAPPTLPTAPSTPSTELPPISSPDTPPTQDHSPATPAPSPSGPSGAHEGFKRHNPSSPISSPKALAQKLFFYGTPNRVASILVPSEPVEPQPVPPTPSSAASHTPGSPPPVVVGSPLGQELLQSPVLGTIPLPEEEEEEVPVPDVETTETQETKPALKTFFGRFGF